MDRLPYATMPLLNASSKVPLMAPIVAEEPLGCVAERAYASHAAISIFQPAGPVSVVFV